VLVSDPQSLRFRHEITRLAVEQEVPAHRRRPIQAGILAALVAAGCEDDARLAHHAEGAADDRTLAFAIRAAHRAVDLASHREAAAQYQRALRFADGQDDGVVADLCDRFAFEASLIDRFQDVADARERALELWRRLGDRAREGATLRRLSSTMWRLCRGRESSEYTQAAVAVLEPLGPSDELAWAYMNISDECATNADTEGGLIAARKAQRLAEELHLPALLADALNAEGCVLAYAGGDWEPSLRRALAVAERIGAADQAGRAYANLYEFYRSSMCFADGEWAYVDGVAFCQERDLPVYVACLQGRHTEALVAMGRWDETVALGRRVLAGAASPINRLTSLVSVGTVLARRGDDAAWELLDEALESGLGTAEPIWIAPARIVRAEAYWLQDRSAEAARELEAARPYALRCNGWVRGAFESWVRRTGADVSVPTDQVAEPYRLAAVGEFAAAEQAWTALDCPYDAALALFDSGAEAELREALQRFESLGADAAAQATRREMRRRGIRSVPAGARASTRSHPVGLTRREDEVLELICSGHSNAEIAGRLYISAKTVDHHVSAVLAKLGVPSRGMAASEALRLGLAGAAK
jgi:DNA-binding CsgD family transcriptional regulator